MKTLWLAVLLAVTALLPVKFTHPTGMPDIPADFSTDIFSLIYNMWSAHFFVCASAVLLLLTVFLFFFRCCNSEQDGHPAPSSLQVFLLFALALSAGLGFIHASCPEYARQTADHFAGLACYAATVFLALRLRRDLLPKLLIALGVGTVIALLAGYDQIFGAIQETEDFVYAQGVDGQLSDKMKRQLSSDRIFGTFNLCNTYAGFLAAMLPLFLYGAWRWAEKRVKPPRTAQIILVSVVLILFAVPIWMTGSRGAILSLTIGLLAVTAFTVRTKRSRLILSGLTVFVMIAITLLVIFRRGADSMIFRLDYDLAALKMMLTHPFAGSGWGDFFYEYPALKQLCNDELPRSPHNFPLLMGSQCGIISFLLALSVLVLPLYNGFRKLRKQEKPDLRFASILAALTVLSVNSLMEVGAEIPGYGATLFLLGIAVLYESAEKQNIFPKWGLYLLSGMAILTFLYSGNELRKEYLFSQYAEIAGPWSTEGSDGTPQYKAAIAASERSPFIRGMRIRELLRQGRTAEVEKLVDEALVFAPQDSSFYRLKYRLLQHRSASEEDLEKVRSEILDLDPNNPENSKL